MPFALRPVIVQLRSVINREVRCELLRMREGERRGAGGRDLRSLPRRPRLDHLIEASTYRVAGTAFGCPHEIPRVKPLRGAPAGIAASGRHHTAGAP